jgi:hypothetical protein
MLLVQGKQSGATELEPVMWRYLLALSPDQTLYAQITISDRVLGHQKRPENSAGWCQHRSTEVTPDSAPGLPERGTKSRNDERHH